MSSVILNANNASCPTHNLPFLYFLEKIVKYPPTNGIKKPVRFCLFHPDNPIIIGVVIIFKSPNICLAPVH